MLQTFSLEGKVALVTGGTGVLGQAMAVALAAAGARVAITGRDLGRTQAAAAPGIVPLAMDGHTRDSMLACDQALVAAQGPLDILVNGVGGNLPEATTGDGRSFFDLPHDALSQVFDLNLVSGLVQPVQVFAKGMAASGRGGSIINISSIVSTMLTPQSAIYSATKAAVDAIIASTGDDTVAAELAKESRATALSHIDVLEQVATSPS